MEQPFFLHMSRHFFLTRYSLGATESAILFSTEPLWTALLAMSGWITGIREHLSPLQLAGGLLILAATLVAELGPRLLRRFRASEAEDAIG
jgi:drug/metabolite transporter (DMT)-like permease